MANGAPEQQWKSATRYLTLGVLMAGFFMVVWWQNRIADNFEIQKQILLNIQRDILVAQGQLGTLTQNAGTNDHRLVILETQQNQANQDRQIMRETDQQLIDALVRLRADIKDPAGPHTRDKR